LDRSSLLDVASAGRGQYFELNRESDRAIASTIVEATRRRAGSLGVELGFNDLYAQCLLAAAFFLCLGIPWSRDRQELWLVAAGTGATLLVVWTAVT
jgi:hypothetical protein